ncbi:Uncharacterised protein [Raoultella terrigena]|uniref:Uncharacterized protein n=1 Tax=Raoultella terrigena TaxID=577 RepID=A0A485BF97_RAOTE|nr:Uncharacterised protein [Raoultella terrigena]
MWQTLTEWFEKAGYKKIFSNVGPVQAGIQGVRVLNEYIQKGYKVVTLINDGLLERSDSNLSIPTHWIVWNGPVIQDSKGNIHLDLFSWGNTYDQIKHGKDISFFISEVFWRNGFYTIKIT